MDVINKDLFTAAFNQTKKTYGENFPFTKFQVINQYFSLTMDPLNFMQFQMHSFPATCGTVIIAALVNTLRKKETKIAFEIMELTCKKANKTALIYLTAANQTEIKTLLHRTKWRTLNYPFTNRNSGRLNTLHIRNIYIND